MVFLQSPTHRLASTKFSWVVIMGWISPPKRGMGPPSSPRTHRVGDSWPFISELPYTHLLKKWVGACSKNGVKLFVSSSWSNCAMMSTKVCEWKSVAHGSNLCKWKSNSDWGWCFVGAYFLAKFQAGGAYRGGAYKKKRVYPRMTTGWRQNTVNVPVIWRHNDHYTLFIL